MALISGLITGGLYGAMALGLTMLYGVIHVFNMGHGVIAVLGAYLAWFFFKQLTMGLLPAIFLSCIGMFIFGLGIYFLVMRRLLRMPNWEFASIVFMLGFSIFLENIILQIFGPRVKYIPKFFNGALEIEFLSLNWHEAGLIAIVILFFIGMHLFLKFTRFGQAMRAVSQQPQGARVVGINVERVFCFAFALSIAITGFSGILLGTKYFMNPHIGWDWMLKGFVIVCLGGLGSVVGAVYAAFMLGLIESVVMLYLGALWVWPIWFFLFLVILLLRPHGLAGGRTI